MSKLIKVGLPCPSLVAAQDLVQEYRRLGKRKPKPIKTVTILTRRANQVIKRQDFKVG